MTVRDSVLTHTDGTRCRGEACAWWNDGGHALRSRAVTVTIFHNVTTDGHGRMLGMLDGYTRGHALTPVARHRFRDVTHEDDVLSTVFMVWNIGHEIDPPDPRALAYRERRNRSFSVGDVVQITEPDDKSSRWFACASVGWEKIDRPAWFALNVNRHGTTAIELDID